VKLMRNTPSDRNTHNMSAGVDILREIDKLLVSVRGNKVVEKDSPTVEKLSVAL
jgi:hypothetical protein